MLGWEILIQRVNPERPLPERVLARWVIGPRGLDWLDQLVKEGKAELLLDGGYPTRFAAVARDVLPKLAGAPPRHDGPLVIGEDYILPGGWPRDVRIDRDKLSACPPDEKLVIEAWDLS